MLRITMFVIVLHYATRPTSYHVLIFEITCSILNPLQLFSSPDYVSRMIIPVIVKRILSAVLFNLTLRQYRFYCFTIK